MAAEIATDIETTMKAHPRSGTGWEHVISTLSGVWHDTAHTSSSGVAWFVCGTVTPAGTIGPDAWLVVVCGV